MRSRHRCTWSGMGPFKRSYWCCWKWMCKVFHSQGATRAWYVLLHNPSCFLSSPVSQEKIAGSSSGGKSRSMIRWSRWCGWGCRWCGCGSSHLLEKRNKFLFFQNMLVIIIVTRTQSSRVTHHATRYKVLITETPLYVLLVVMNWLSQGFLPTLSYLTTP